MYPVGVLFGLGTWYLLLFRQGIEYHQVLTPHHLSRSWLLPRWPREMPMARASPPLLLSSYRYVAINLTIITCLLGYTVSIHCGDVPGRFIGFHSHAVRDMAIASFTLTYGSGTRTRGFQNEVGNLFVVEGVERNQPPLVRRYWRRSLPITMTRVLVPKGQ